MIRSSFCFLEKIGRGMERKIWMQGITDWNKFLNRKVKGISPIRKCYFNRRIVEARKALYSSNSSYFALHLPKTEHWRLYGFFKEETAFLDIEVDNIGKAGDVLMICISDGINTNTMIRGINLDFNALGIEIRKYRMIATFNGSVFDLPFIRKRYPNLIPPLPQFDLRFACRRLGLNGGLKKIEKKLGIKRGKTVEGICGGDVLLLWKKYLATGDDYYLRLLVEYNEEDAFNLKKIADYCYKRLMNTLVHYHNIHKLRVDACERCQ